MVSNHPLFKGDSSPTYSLSFLEVGVFSPKINKKTFNKTLDTNLVRLYNVIKIRNEKRGDLKYDNTRNVR